MTVPFGPFRLVVSLSRRCREALMIDRAVEASDTELARLATHRGIEAELVRIHAEQMMYGARLV